MRPLQLCDLRDDQDKDWRWTFLAKLAETCSVSASCVAARVSRDTAYNHRNKFPKFRAKWDEAIEIAIEALEVNARQRALDRSDPASATFTIFLLKAHRPEMYRDTVKQIVVGDNDGPVQVSYVNNWRSIPAEPVEGEVPEAGPDDPPAVPPPGTTVRPDEPA